MSKIKKIFSGLSLLMKKPHLINNVLNSNEVLAEVFTKEFPNSRPTKQVSLDSIYKMDQPSIVAPYSFLSGSSLITDFLLLKLACARTKASDYLEIGTWRGESVANVADVVENCFTLNLSDKQLAELQLPKKYIESHRFFSKDRKNVTHLFGDSNTFDFEGLNRKFDVIFIDGDHHTKAVESDTKRLFPFLKKQNSLIVWHDAKRDTETPRFEVLLGIYRGIPVEKHKYIYLVENSLCAIYIPEELDANLLEIYKKPERFFELQVTIKGNQ